MEESDEGEGEVSREENWESLGKEVVPVVAAIEDGEILAYVEV